MSDFLDEEVPRMPPVSMKIIEETGDGVLKVLCPDALRQPTPIDFLHLVDYELQRHGIFVTPASFNELGDRLGATDPSGEGEINILINEELWEQLLAGGRIAHRARATISHELSHAVLHVPVMRRRMKSSQRNLLLSRRVARKELKPFEDPEWQAWALAGCIVAPRRTLEMFPAGTPLDDLANHYGVSASMMRSHVKRLKLGGRFGG